MEEKSSSKLHLISSFYTAESSSRNAELEKTLIQNIQSEYIERIHLFIDDEISLNKLKDGNFATDKIEIIKICKQPLYSDLVSYANLLTNKLCIIANSDIWIDSIEDIRLLTDMKKFELYALTRYESDMTSPLINKYQGSHDAFIFHSPIPESIIKHIQFPQNVWGSENVLLYELNKFKYEIKNPCFQIKIVHEHMSNERKKDRIRINRGDIDGDGIYSRRSLCVAPSKIKLL
uniref:Glycosyltransferase n=1 Tax=viral metagenome TaxID=1070528 RepID=A0A6C0E4G2_9ZZZZ